MAIMTTKHKPYPTYKPSGVEWLREIPAHWEVKRLWATVLSCQNGVWGAEPNGSNDIACVRVADFDRVRFRANIDRPTLRSVETDVFQTRKLYPGDLLLEVSGGGEKQPVGAVVLYDNEQPAVCSNFIAQLRPSKGFEPNFLAYLHSTLYSARVNVRSIKQSTGIQNLDKASYLNEAAGFPSLPEQRAIAVFLDRETAKIDSLVAMKERLIELLQEKRTAIISRAVTKGLDPNVPMKDSGVEWLGEIPAHWEVKRVKHICLVRRGASPRPIANPAYFDANGEYGWVRIADVTASNQYLNQTSEYVSELGRSLSVSLEPGELIVSIAGSVGKPIITDMKCCIHDGFVHFLGVSEHLEYLYYILSSDQPYIGLGKVGTQLNLNTDTIGDIQLPVPSLSEQRSISERLDSQTTKIDALIAKFREAIERFQELRFALISAAVTGRIDVREEAA